MSYSSATGGHQRPATSNLPLALAAFLPMAWLTSTTGHAHEEPFAYTRGSQVEAKGEWEVEEWTTLRLGKKSGDYLGLDFSTEIEYGLTDRLQGSLYLNSRYHSLSHVEGGHETFEDRNEVQFDGVSGELKYQVSNAYRDPWGFALYFEPGYSSISRTSGEPEDKVSLEFKLITEKHFADDRLIAAFNFTVEPEWEREPGESWATALELEWALGLSVRLAPTWRLGVEARVDTEWEDMDPNHAEFSTFSVGPTLHHAGESWFCTLSVLPQVFGWPDAPGTGGRHLDDREQVEIRMKFGFEF